ncbi:MAG: 4Fe-4S dicluster domain-containing protein [Deltaproteobacteria bacterium]|nr:MAG: 4Fe-4S dicluster domain-containing protein [Deltaproteobacteria bacterium]
MNVEWMIALGFMGLVIFFSLYKTKKESEEAKQVLEDSVATGQNLPPSLHPIVDPTDCIGCGACVEACPEKKILGLIYGRASLIQASSCVGHGACKTACPAEAITLVLGTKSHGVTIPSLDAKYQTTVQGLHVAGELGGMGLIRNATRQGKLAVRYMAEVLKERPSHVPDNVYDLLVVGFGPAGISASLAAKEMGVTCMAVEQGEEFGGAIASFPRKKLVMGTDVILPLYGRIRARTMQKEELLDTLSDVVQKHDLPITYGFQVSGIQYHEEGWFTVSSDKQDIQARRVLLAIGRRGSPRTLGVPGEEAGKVAYSLRGPEEYQGDKCLVVGGGDSALEAATMLADEPGTQVTLCYRRDRLWRAKRPNIDKVMQYAEEGKIQLLLEASPLEIKPSSVRIQVKDEEVELMNDSVFVFIGGKLPLGFLEESGVEMRTVYGEELLAI